MANRFVRLLVTCLAIGLLALPLAAQEVTRGSIQVTVEDSTGAVVQGAKVTVTSPLVSRSLDTDSTGVAVFLSLTPGTYSVKAEMQGFKTAEGKDIEVTLNRRTSVRLVLEPGAITTVVEVTGAASTLDTTTASIGSNLANTLYQSIPLSRALAASFYLAPGVVDSGGAGAQNPAMGGASGLENLYVIDGVNVTNVGFGAFGTFSRVFGPLGSGVTTSFIKEVQVKTGAMEAQYSQGVGGLVNVVTKSGGNAFHGAVYVYGSPNVLRAEQKQADPFRTTALGTEFLHTASVDFGAEMGGYLLKDKLFFFGAFNPTITNERLRAPRQSRTGLLPANPAACDRLFNQRQRAGDNALCAFPAWVLGEASRHTRTLNYAGKLTWNIASGHVVEASMYGDPSFRSPYLRTLTGDIGTRSQLAYSGLNYTIRYNGAITPTWIITGDWNYNHNRFEEQGIRNDYQVSDRTVTPIVNYGGPGFIENYKGGNKGFDISSSKQFKFFGSHQWDVGFQYQKTLFSGLRVYSGPTWTIPDDPRIRSAETALGTRFVGLTAYGAALRRYNCQTAACRALSPTGQYFRQRRGNVFPIGGTVATSQDYFGAYMQDSWQLNKYFTLKMGLRWEEENMAGTPGRGPFGPLGSAYSFTGIWGPRIGILVDPFGKRRTKAYFNFGRYFERIPQDLAERSLSAEMSWIGLVYRADADGIPRLDQAHYIPYATVRSGAFPREAGATLNGGIPTVMAAGTKQSYQDEFVVGFEHEFKGGIVVGGRYIDRRLKRIVEDIDAFTVEQALNGADSGYALTNVNSHTDIFRAYTCVNPSEPAGGSNPCAVSGFAAGGGEYLPNGDGIPDGFPDAVRNYQAVEITVEKRFSKNWQILANYRIAKLFGNFEGYFRNDNGQVDPAISSLFDFAASDALAAQFTPGPLNNDRRHVVNFYGNYLIDRGFLNGLNIGWGTRFQSGTPLNALAAHPAYENAGEIPLGGRGVNGRLPVSGTVDLHFDYPIKITERFKLRAAFDMFNMFNAKRVIGIDQFVELSAGTPNPDGPFNATLNPDGRGIGSPGDQVTGRGFQRPFNARWALRLEF